MKFYLNMDLELFGYRDDDRGGARFRVYAPASGLPRDQAEEVVLTPELRSQLRRLEERRLGWHELIALGEELAGLLFPPEVRLLLANNLRNLMADEGLRIRLKMETYALANLPWEYVYLLTDDSSPAQSPAKGFLALNPRTSLVRNEAARQQYDSFSSIDREQLRIVTLLSDPNRPPEYPPLGLAEEINKIHLMLNEMRNKPFIQLYSNATPELLEEIVDDAPHVLHFAGYSRFEGDLCVAYGAALDRGSVVLQDAAPFSAEALALNLLDRGIRLVVLGACAAGRHNQVNAWACVAPALTQYASIPAVVSLQYTIDHESIVAFCRRFYRSLNDGKPIDAAVTDGRQAIYNLRDRPDDRDWGVPVVYLRTADPILFPRHGPEELAGLRGSSQSAEVMRRRSVGIGFIEPNHGTADVRVPGSRENVDQRALRDAIIGAFNIIELELLCSDIEQDLKNAGIIDIPVNLDVVGRAPLTKMVLDLITYLDRREHLHYLVDAVRRERPDLTF